MLHPLCEFCLFLIKRTAVRIINVRRNNRMPTHNQSEDEAVVENARRLRIDRRKLRRERFFSGIALIASCIVLTVVVLRRLAGQSTVELNMGFFTGVFLALVWTTCGFLGALLLAKALSGFDGGLRTQELLVRYHDRLRELGELPDAKGEQGAAPNGGPATQLGKSGGTEGPPSVS